MTIDERLEFLMKSTESLHASAHELHEAAAKHSEQIEKNSEQIEKNSRQLDTLIRVVEIDAENIRRLASIAEAHERRLSDLEGE
ncbi:MAG: hypothetical protein ACRD4O_03395 [Bryobacteraceae bacterium]